MQKFITVRMWEEKLERVRIDKAMKEKRVISLAQVIEELVNDYLEKNK